ncbi:FAD-dependent oxidoreductase [Nocardia panacis]|uniref:FAD-dependent oxidoreductase n=1 Tax=Nocardia panacis TaxID=2340916 RepID=A0A3A4JIF5_9NOCA|nr:FAD-dependent monooxygenase [Nocardia panacis]RJO68177.1 FAD-dependent oxidoreductase [Nocardia panacis]
MSENRTDVLIAGAGPNGLMLACELALAGISPVVVERLPGPSGEPRANGLVGSVSRVLDMRGLYTEFGGPAEGPKPLPYYIFSGMAFDMTGMDAGPMAALLIPQPELVVKLLARATELGVQVRWSHELTGFTRDDNRVRVELDGPEGPVVIHTRYLIGADGGKSAVRKLADIEFPGSTAEGTVTRFGHTDVPAAWLTPDGGIEIPGAGRFRFGHNRVERGMFVFAELPSGTMMAIQEFDAAATVVDEDAPMTLAELREAAERVLGAEVPLQPPTGPGPHALRRLVGQNTRVARHYRDGRIFLIGDAAHVHSAIGGPGLNLGLQDAVNLGWKLAAHLNGWAPADLLDTYHAERHPVAERTAMHSLAQSGLMLPGPETAGVRALFGELLAYPQVAAHIANLLAGTDRPYDTGDNHPLSGRLVPDFRLGDGRRVAELLRTARPVLLVTDTVADLAAGWPDRIEVITATGAPAPAMLIRPDGYVAWAADTLPAADDPTLRAALTRWFGPANSLVA